MNEVCRLAAERPPKKKPGAAEPDGRRRAQVVRAGVLVVGEPGDRFEREADRIADA